MTAVERLHDAQRQLDTGALRIDTPEYAELAALAREYCFGLRIPAWQLPRSEITSSGYSGDLTRVLSWMGLRPHERKALLDRYPCHHDSREIKNVRPRFVSYCYKPTYRFSPDRTAAILDEAYEICIRRARERGLL